MIELNRIEANFFFFFSLQIFFFFDSKFFYQKKKKKMTCRLRALWLISTSGNKCRVIISKKYPTVEKRFSQLCAKENLEYTPIPKDEKFLSIFSNSLKERNNNIDRDPLPILHNQSNLKSSLWPLVYLKAEHEPLYLIGCFFFFFVFYFFFFLFFFCFFFCFFFVFFCFLKPLSEV